MEVIGQQKRLKGVGIINDINASAEERKVNVTGYSSNELTFILKNMRMEKGVDYRIVPIANTTSCILTSAGVQKLINHFFDENGQQKVSANSSSSLQSDFTSNGVNASNNGNSA